jgi:hypothetical protein
MAVKKWRPIKVVHTEDGCKKTLVCIKTPGDFIEFLTLRGKHTDNITYVTFGKTPKTYTQPHQVMTEHFKLELCSRAMPLGDIPPFWKERQKA